MEKFTFSFFVTTMNRNKGVGLTNNLNFTSVREYSWLGWAIEAGFRYSRLLVVAVNCSVMGCGYGL